MPLHIFFSKINVIIASKDCSNALNKKKGKLCQL